MDKPTVDLAKIVEDCELAFWDRVATKHMPLVKKWRLLNQCKLMH
jgi:hypothetical protein